MRTYYAFNINKEMSILSKESPYMLFKSFESIYKGKKNDLNMATNLYEQLTSKFNKALLSTQISQVFKDNEFYMCNNLEHKFFNKYRDEKCEVTIKNSYLIVKTNMPSLNLVRTLKGYNLFLCDFENKDYFWLDEICC